MATRRKRFTLKPEPKKPEGRLTITRRLDFENGENLQALLDKIPVPYKQVTIVTECDYDCVEDYLVWEEPESDIEMDSRFADYYYEMEKYREWYEKNEASIKEELTLRAQEKKEKDLKRKEAEKRRIATVKKRLEKEMKKLAKEEKELNRDR